MAKTVKGAGKSTSESRRLSMHGLKSERSAMKNSAWLRANAAKPRGGSSGWGRGGSSKPGKGKGK